MRIPDPTQRNIWYRPGAAGGPALILVHGLDSNVRECWLNQRGKQPIFWPELIATEPSLQDWGIFLGGYHASDGGGVGIPECTDDLYSSLNSDPSQPLDRAPLVFLCHSLGGVVVRKMLVDHYERFRNKTVFLVLLASPSAGTGIPKVLAGPVLRILGVFKDKTLSKQLTIERDVLLELDRQFRRLLDSTDDRFVAGLGGIERSETQYLKGVPLLGRVVDYFSSQHYFPEPKQLAHENHSTIAKPSDRHSPVHQLLIERLCLLHQPKTLQHHFPDSLSGLANDLQDHFGFRFEPPVGGSPAGPGVYWPVRLRRPSPIHAQQSFAAAALTKLNLRVELWIDDFGNQDYAPGLFEQRLRGWFSTVGGVDAKLSVHLFSERLEDDETKREAWQLTRKWLGDTQQPLEEVLRLSKLLPSSGDDSSSLADLIQKRPRRLLTPPIVWLGLRLMAKAYPGAISLGGIDETALWDAWRRLGIDPTISAGHLYGARLSEIGRTGARHDLRLKVTPLAWDSVADIRDALARNSTASVERDTLAVWSLEQCVFLPQYVQGELPSVSVRDRVYRSISELWNLPAADRDEAAVRAIADRLL